jgi:hypothetical protein
MRIPAWLDAASPVVFLGDDPHKPIGLDIRLLGLRVHRYERDFVALDKGVDETITTALTAAASVFRTRTL